MRKDVSMAEPQPQIKPGVVELYPVMDVNRHQLDIRGWRDIGLWVIVIGVPVEMIAPHDAQCKKNHSGQSLQRMWERGGLSASEMLAVLEDREFTFAFDAHQQLHAKVLSWLNAKKT